MHSNIIGELRMKTRGQKMSVPDEHGVVLSAPWDVDRMAQGPLPPETVWVSRKDDKAYVYDLVRV